MPRGGDSRRPGFPPPAFVCLFSFCFLVCFTSIFLFSFLLGNTRRIAYLTNRYRANVMGQFGWSRSFPGGSDGKESVAVQDMWVRSLCWEDPMEKEMVTTLVLLPGKSHGQRIPESYSLQGRDWATNTLTSHFLSKDAQIAGQTLYLGMCGRTFTKRLAFELGDWV